LCFGAGGSAVAIALHLINKTDPGDRPKRLVVVNRSQGRLDHLQAMVNRLDTDIAFEYILNNDPRRNDELMAQMPEGSIIINATGMGKDTPGSPITNDGLFPVNSIAWELNYRGELDFMHQALAQPERRSVRVEDGWVYFVHGWTQVIAQVYHVEIDGALFERLKTLADSIRG
jgi:shikimate 5-dehydrogenase